MAQSTVFAGAAAAIAAVYHRKVSGNRIPSRSRGHQNPSCGSIDYLVRRRRRRFRADQLRPVGEIFAVVLGAGNTVAAGGVRAGLNDTTVREEYRRRTEPDGEHACVK